jgi:putative transcriptional regulator
MNLLGNLLIAPPAVKGNFWHKTVILITEHHQQGSAGLVLNKRSELSINDFSEQIGINLDVPGYVYIGGPVSSQSLSLLHSSEWSCSNTLNLNNGFSISSSGEIMPRLSAGDAPRHWRLFLGLCGWAHKQLIHEIQGNPPWRKEHSWCTVSPDYSLVFDTDGKEQWCKALDHSAAEFAQNILT